MVREVECEKRSRAPRVEIEKIEPTSFAFPVLSPVTARKSCVKSCIKIERSGAGEFSWFSLAEKSRRRAPVLLVKAQCASARGEGSQAWSRAVESRDEVRDGSRSGHVPLHHTWALIKRK